MKKKNLRNVLFVACAALFALTVSCSDDPSAEHYYTAKGDYANTYLLQRPETFSKFVEIIKKSKVVNLDLLGTYGSYTVFAPTNAAVDNYLMGRGKTSVAELTVEDCDTIAATHIIEQSYYTTDFSDATLPKMNMLDRYLTITCDSDYRDNGKIDIAYYINNDSKIIARDDSVENGVVHTMDRIINATSEMLPDLIRKDTTITLFNLALELTHLSDSMQVYIDENYYCSPDSFEKGHTFQTGEEYDNVFYMEKRYYGFTAFIEPDEVYASRGINNIEDLKAYAKQVYDDMYPEDADITDPTDRRNSLNRFVSYHFLPARIIYNMLTCDNVMLKCFDRRHWDVAEWYETMMPFSLMKISFPSGSEAARYVNRRGVQNRKDSRGVKIPGAKILSPGEANKEVNKGSLVAVNGVYHYIKDIIHYGRETQEFVMDERLRFDASTLSPDFLTSGARGHSVRGEGGCPSQYGMYGKKMNEPDPELNVNTCLGFKGGTAKNFIYDDVNTHLHVRNRYLNFWPYQGDEVTICGRYDVQFKLPPVPEGTYELRIGTIINWPTRGIIQVYLDGDPCGIPIDMRKNGDDPSIGHRRDSDIGEDEEAIVAYDKALHNRGWMKAPKSWGPINQDGTGNRDANGIRDTPAAMRRIFATFYTDGKTEHWVRLQQKLESLNGTFAFDFLELCPRSVYNNENYPEDKY